MNKNSTNIALLDIGNTAIKVGIADSETKRLKITKSISTEEECRSFINNHNCNAIVYSNVRPGILEKNISTPTCSKIINAKNIIDDSFIKFEKSLDIGIDRKLACLGATPLTKNAFIVFTLGTANTVSFVSNNECKHSFVWPGLQISAKALTDNTRLILNSKKYYTDKPEPLNKEQITLEESCDIGIYYSAVYAIDAWIDYFKNLTGNKISVFLTGGFAHVLQLKLKSETKIIPNLTLRGLLAFIPKVDQ